MDVDSFRLVQDFLAKALAKYADMGLGFHNKNMHLIHFTLFNHFRIKTHNFPKYK